MKMESIFNHDSPASWAPPCGLAAFGLDSEELSVEFFL